MAENTAKPGTFDRLVSAISDSEREVLLQKMHSLASGLADNAGDDDKIDFDAPDFSIEENLKKEGIFYRFLLWLRAIFTSTSQEEIYNQDLILSMFRKLDHDYPGILDFKGGLILDIFYQKLCELKVAAEFFRPYLNYIYEDTGAFYTFLGSLICPDVTKQMDEEVDPFLLPLNRQVTGELRTSLLRKMEEIIKGIPSHLRSQMYVCVQAVEWIHQFTKLPYERFINAFTVGGNNTYSCRFEMVSSELNVFARIMCNLKSIPEEALTAIYLFSADKIVPVDSTANGDDERAKEFMDKSAANIALIKMFAKTVPLRRVNPVVFNNIQWHPDNFVGGEDWFVKYKEQWKKLFDEKWNSWLRDKKKNEINTQLTTIFGLDAFPKLPDRPWAAMWSGIPFHFEYTAGFIWWFMTKRYNDILAPLKILLLEGAFANKDNRQEFANTMNDLLQIYNDMDALVEDLSSVGQVGMVFEKLAANHLKTLQAQSKIESTMLMIEATVQNVKNQFCNDIRSVERILNGVLELKKDTRYDGVVNLNQLSTGKNSSLKEQLVISKNVLSSVLDMLKEIEPIDVPEKI
ncbi:MAG: DUF5312 domain-containing protein [Treponema sp.]|nr:DUF5312 domain-containing protein [Treponema sp.]